MRKSIGTKTGTQSFAGLCLICCCLLFPALSGRTRPFGGFLTQTSFNFNGNNTLIDSFDSSDPTKSLWQTNWSYNGRNYGTYANTLRTADVTVGMDGSVFNVGNAQIYGSVDTAPGGSILIQHSGSVGDLTWVPTVGIQAGHLYDDMNVVFSDVVLPLPVNSYGSGWLPLTKLASNTNMTIGGTSYSFDYIITNIVGKPGTPTNQIYWKLSSLGKGDSLVVNASNVVLYLPGGITMKSGDNLSLNTNSSVTIYTGDSIDTGNGLVNNATQYAVPFKIYGLPPGVDSAGDTVNGCTAISFGGNAALTSWIYAPEASVTFNGGGSTTYDVVGSFMVHDVTVNGHYNFHFDVQLKWTLPPFRYVADNWQETH